jgi:hypothetical protein
MLFGIFFVTLGPITQHCWRQSNARRNHWNSNLTLQYQILGNPCHLFSVQGVSSPEHKGSIAETGICLVFTEKWKMLHLFEILFILVFIMSSIICVRLARNNSKNVFHFANFWMKCKTESNDCYSSAAANHSRCFYCPCAMKYDPLQIYLTRFTVINIYHRNNDCEIGEVKVIMFVMRCCYTSLPTSVQIS